MADISTVKLWFDNLGKIHGRMLQLNHDTKTDLLAFSKQSQKEILISAQIKGNLEVFCQSENIGIVVPSAFNDEKSFRWFLDKVSFSISESLKTLIYAFAVEKNPNIGNISQPDAMRMKLKEVFPTETSRNELNQIFISAIPKEFYPSDGSLLADGEKTLSIIVKSIAN